MAGTRERMRAALPVAMKARDAVAVAALRATLGAIDNAEAVERPVGAERGQAIEQSAVGVGAAEAGRPDRAQRLRAEARVLSAYLP